jgi:alpha-ketoglutarate-dependent taurine dioxygenase
MKTRALKNYDSSVGCEVYDIDLNSDAEILELGRMVASQCIVFVDQEISTQRLAQVMEQWGQPSRALVHDFVINKTVQGRHWREILLNLGLAATGVKEISKAVSSITYRKDDKNRPMGMFTNGELDWHSDQCAFDDAPRVIGLQSISDTADSQTTFLCTHDAYQSLSSDMQSMVKELVCRHKWRDGVMAPGLNETQTLIIHYNMVPIDGMETRLYSENAMGLPGIKLPSHSFDGFVGMSQAESYRVFRELKKAIFQDRWVYTQNWQDGQIVFMDQEITLHARPTNVKDGDARLMSRVITYLDHICKTKLPSRTVRVDGRIYTHDEFARLVDSDRLRIFEQQQQGGYTSLDRSVTSNESVSTL